MAQNITERSLASLLAQAEAMLAAGPGFWWQAGLRSESPENLLAALNAARDAECVACSAIALRIEAQVCRDAFDREIYDFISTARHSLRKSLGRQWSQDWARIGFPSAPEAIPQQLERRLLVLRSLGEYLRLNPQQQRDSVGLTAERAHKLAVDVKHSMCAVEARTAELKQANEVRGHALVEIKRIMRCLTAELHQVLRQNDPRWLAAYSAQGCSDAYSGPSPNSNSESTLSSLSPVFPGSFRLKRIHDQPQRHSRRQSMTTTKSKTNRLLVFPQHQPLSKSRAISPVPHRPSVDLASLGLTSLMAWLFPPHI